ncbi:MAG: hypothetical protein WBA68_02695 [Alteraurantiacibacter sp.]
MGIVVVISALAAFYSWQLNDSCFGDRCIGALILTGFTVLMVIASLIAGAIRWAAIDIKERRDSGWNADL